MKLKITRSFRNKLNEQVDYIAKDKPSAARKFKAQVLDELRAIPKMPYKHRKSIFFNREDIRDLIIRGYLVVYKVNSKENAIEVFGFTRYENDPFNTGKE